MQLRRQGGKWRKRPKRKPRDRELWRKRRMVEYLQWLWDKVLEEEAILLEGAKGSQVFRFKCKEVITGDEEGQQLSKKAREKQQGKYCGGVAVKMGGANPCKRYVSAGQYCGNH